MVKMSPLIEILLLTAGAAFAPNFTSCGELTDAVKITNEAEALKRVQLVLNEKSTEILDEVANDALFSSMLRKRGKMCEILINYAADADPEFKFSSEVVEWTLEFGMESILDLLMTKNVDYNGLNKFTGCTFVFAAIRHDRLGMLKKLMGKKGYFRKGLLDIRTRKNYGETALHRAANSRKYGAPMMEVLLKAGANSCVTDEVGLTPLEYAIVRSNEECVKVLIKYDAEPISLECAGKNASENILLILEGYEVAIRNGVKGAIYLEIYEKIAEFFHK